jgi:hypothetical protein
LVRYAITIGSFALAALAFAETTEAGIPRGVVLIADEQDADAATGITIARGNAEIKIEKQPIAGRADSIELNPVRNEIIFKGHTLVTVNRDRYEGAAVTCALDFSKCAAMPPPQDDAAAQALPPPAALGAAVINPR